MMLPAAQAAIRAALEDWRREAAGSTSQAERYADAARRVREDAEPIALEHEERAAEHRSDAEQALRNVAELEQTLRDEGLEP